MYFDGSFTLNGSGGGVVLISPKGDQLLFMIRLHFCTTNNVVEYEAPINAMHIAAEPRVQQLYICVDSELDINQVMGESNYHDSRMAAYRHEVRKLEEMFESSREPPPLSMFT
jgi:ribonuclease HI